MARQNLTGAAIDTDDKRLRASGLYEDWAEGAYTVGDIRNAKGQTWECFQAHDTATYPDINPENAAWFTFWRPLHGTTPETARPFVPVQGAHDMYRTGSTCSLHRRQDLQVPERHQLLPRGLRPGLGGRGGIKKPPRPGGMDKTRRIWYDRQAPRGAGRALLHIGG
ncbi:MAG: hypothetical protein ACLT09_00650 [Flavonifractor plautii]